MEFTGGNIDRAFWAIGRGESGSRSLLKLIRNEFYPKSGFPECVAMYQEDELPTYVDLLSSYCVWKTSQEGTEGGSPSIRSARQNLYKKCCPGDPMPARLPTLRDCDETDSATRTPTIRTKHACEVRKHN